MSKTEQAIQAILRGAPVEDVVAEVMIDEDLARTSAMYAASMMHFSGDSREEASKKARHRVGIEPADDTLHVATVNSGTPKAAPTYSYITKAGIHEPAKDVDPQKEKKTKGELGL